MWLRGLKDQFKSPQMGTLLGSLGWLGAVSRTIALTLAAVRAGMLAAALAFAIVLSLTGVLRRIRRVLGHEHTGLRRGAGILRRLGVYASSGATEKAGKCSRQS